ncbi:hypothetical protein DMH17_07880 [Raoultella planticola]|nr:hypothetical protein [Raoultella planticola]
MSWLKLFSTNWKSRTFNGFKAVHAIDLENRGRRVYGDVGPSGCAKSTTLRMLAGLEPSAAAKCVSARRSSTTFAPKRAVLRMVFQNYAPLPAHMTVRENLAFGLKLSKPPKDQIDAQVNEAAKTPRAGRAARPSSAPAFRRPGPARGGWLPR